MIKKFKRYYCYPLLRTANQGSGRHFLLIYIYIYICMYVCIYTYKYIQTWLSQAHSTYIYVCMIYINTFIHDSHMRFWHNASFRPCVYVDVWYIHTPHILWKKFRYCTSLCQMNILVSYICMYIYIYIYIHTYTTHVLEKLNISLSFTRPTYIYIYIYIYIYLNSYNLHILSFWIRYMYTLAIDLSSYTSSYIAQIWKWCTARYIYSTCYTSLAIDLSTYTCHRSIELYMP